MWRGGEGRERRETIITVDNYGTNRGTKTKKEEINLLVRFKVLIA